MEDQQCTTPPHHPTHNINIPDNIIRSIIMQCVSPLPSEINISRLPSGQSFNNRIYFINTEVAEYVLKVNGRFFGPAKVENEVACLILVGHFCPTVPLPRVIAFSNDGSRVRSYNNCVIRELGFRPESTPGWILMSRLQGEPLALEDLQPVEQREIAQQLAEYVAFWRKAIPTSSGAGNLHFVPDSSKYQIQYTPSENAGLNLFIYGLQGIGNGEASAMPSLNTFWKAKLLAMVNSLGSAPVLHDNRAVLAPVLQRFMDNTFDHLPIFQDENMSSSFVFTHTDLAPRNVLVSGSPKTITGIVDFEFAGFFPLLDEFVTEQIENVREGKGNWPIEMFNTIQKGVDDALGLSTLTMKSLPIWEEVFCLNTLELYIAPWWLAQGVVASEILESDLQEARQRVEEAIWRLERISEKSRPS